MATPGHGDDGTDLAARLAAWRAGERELANAGSDAARIARARDVERLRAEYQRAFAEVVARAREAASGASGGPLAILPRLPIFEAGRSPMLLMDPANGRIVDANPAAASFYGHTREHLRELSIWELNTATPGEIGALMGAVLAEGVVGLRVRHRLASGEERALSLDAGPVEINGLLLNFAILHDVSAEVAAEREARADAARHEILAEFMSAAALVRDDASVLALLVRRVVEHVGGTCGVYRPTADGASLRFVALAGEGPEHVRRIRAVFEDRPWPVGDGIMGEALRLRQTVSRDLTSPAAQAAYLATLPTSRRAQMADIELRSVVAVPLMRGREPFALLTIAAAGADARPYSDGDRTLVENLAARAALILTQLDLEADRERAAQRAGILADFLEGVIEGDGVRNDDAILQALADAAAAGMGDLCSVKLLDQRRERLELRSIAASDRALADGVRGVFETGPLAMERTIDAAVFRDARPILRTFEPDEFLAAVDPAFRSVVAPGFASVLAVPLWAEGRIAGDVLLMRRADRPAYDERDLEFAEDLARRASLALERLRADRERLATLSRLEAVLAASPIAFILIDLDQKVRLWSPGAEALFGWNADEVVGSEPPAFIPADLVEDSQAMRRRVFAGETIHAWDTRRIRRDGTEVHVLAFLTPLRSDAGSVTGAVLALIDQEERRRLEADLAQAQKMETVGLLAAGIAHDFNNLLTTIRGYADLVDGDLPGGSPSHDDVGQIRSASERAAALTAQLLAFSRRSVLQPVVLDPDAVVTGLLPMLGRLLGEDVRLIAIRSPRPLAVQADRGRLEQVIVNLAVNARDAMPNGGSLRIETTLVDLDETYTRSHAGIAPGPYVMLAVTDSGSGMSPEVAARVFEPFFTTKERGHGTGLGLSTVDGVVRQSGGSVSVYSEPGSGTVFKVYLPLVQAPVETTAVPAREPIVLDGTETILLVEDEQAVRELASIVLRSHGYTVAEAASGEEALEIASSLAHLDLLITDVVLTGITGRAAADGIVAVHPAAAVLYVSGYTEDTVVHHGVLEEGISFLPKPFSPAGLARAVRQTLDRRNG